MSFWKRLFGGGTAPTLAAPVPPQSSSPSPKAAPTPPPSTQCLQEPVSQNTPQSGLRPVEPTSGNANFDTKLIRAIKDRNVDEVQSLLAAGANANVRASWARDVAPAIHFALEQQYGGKEEACLQIIGLLLKYGAHVDSQGPDGYDSKKGPFTPLMNAVQNNRAKTVEWLIERGANTSIRTLDGRTAFQLAMDDERHSDDKDHWAVVRVLAERSIDGKTWAQSPEGKTWLRDREEDTANPLGVSRAGAWSDFQQHFTKGEEEIIRWVESGGNVNWTCSHGYTLLHYAAYLNNAKMVHFLLDHGADVNARNSSGKSPGSCALQFRRAERQN